LRSGFSFSTFLTASSTIATFFFTLALSSFAAALTSSFFFSFFSSLEPDGLRAFGVMALIGFVVLGAARSSDPRLASV